MYKINYIHKIKAFIKKCNPWLYSIYRRYRNKDNYISGGFSHFNFFEGKFGVEIGGPSEFFNYTIPIYKVIAGLDNVNFSSKTMWEGTIKEGSTYNYFNNKYGSQFISEASDLNYIKSNYYDFLISSNCLEHIANPIKAIEEWLRITKSGGYLLLILPNKSSNFDHRRQVTTFEHLISDYNNNIMENDLTHLDEILRLHDLTLDKAAGNLEKFKKRSLDNFSNRGLHHHVYDEILLKEIFEYFKQILVKIYSTKYDCIALVRVCKSN